MASPQQYRQYAAHCIYVAQQIQDPADKVSLLLKAEVWMSLAEQAEQAAYRWPMGPQGGNTTQSGDEDRCA